MDISVTENAPHHRFEIKVDGEVAGYTMYQIVDPHRYAFIHTEIGEQFEGQGLASKLIQATLEDMRSRGITVIPICPFVKSFLERHPDYADVTA